jgi:hypothetical protein
MSSKHNHSHKLEALIGLLPVGDRLSGAVLRLSKIEKSFFPDLD